MLLSVVSTLSSTNEARIGVSKERPFLGFAERSGSPNLSEAHPDSNGTEKTKRAKACRISIFRDLIEVAVPAFESCLSDL